MVWYDVARLNQRIFKVLQSFIFAHSSISTAIQRSNNEDIKQQRGKTIRRFKESVHGYFPKKMSLNFWTRKPSGLGKVLS